MSPKNDVVESPIESEFLGALRKYAAGGLQLETQVEVVTICGKFRLDLVAVFENGRRVAFECDGKEFHKPSRDEWRDAMILGKGFVDCIYRLRGVTST